MVFQERLINKKVRIFILWDFGNQNWNEILKKSDEKKLFATKKTKKKQKNDEKQKFKSALCIIVELSSFRCCLLGSPHLEG